jgi:hypothetical protein
MVAASPVYGAYHAVTTGGRPFFVFAGNSSDSIADGIYGLRSEVEQRR